jgi:hypothetical protein
MGKGKSDRRGRRRKQLLDDLKGSERVSEIEKGIIKSLFVKNRCWKRQWNCLKTGAERMNSSNR